MNIRRAIREERNDVYEVIVTKKEIQNDEIVEVEHVEKETTIQQLADTINAQTAIKEEAEKQIADSLALIEDIENYKLQNPE